MSENKPLATRIMAAWMRLQGHSEDQIAETEVGSIEDEVLALETVVVVKTKEKPEGHELRWLSCDANEESFQQALASMGYADSQPLNPVPGKQVATETVKCTPVESMSCQKCGDFCDGNKTVSYANADPATFTVTPEPLSTCPDCGEFRWHGHEDVCPMAWVEITDPGHVLRPDDELNSIKNRGYGTGWVTFNRLSRIGDTLGKHRLWADVRCRRKDLPPVPVKIIEVDPGEGYRWLEDTETVLPTDEILMPDRDQVWVKPGDGPFRNAGYHGWDVRRAILNPTRKPVRLFADTKTRQVIACFGDGKDSAHKWAIDDVEIHYDGTQFFVEPPQ